MNSDLQAWVRTNDSVGRRWGYWLLCIGIGSQLLPLLGLGAPLEFAFRNGQAAVGILGSVVGGLLVGLSSVTRQIATAQAVMPDHHVNPAPSSRPTPPSAEEKPAVPRPAAAKRRRPAATVKTPCSVVLVSAGLSKISVIREVRAITGRSLTEAADLVEGAPKTIKQKISRKEAGEIKARLEVLGATVKLQ